MNHASPTAADPLVGGSVPFYFRSRKFEWQTSGDNGKQQALIAAAAEIRPAAALVEGFPDVMGGKGKREGGKKTKTLFACAANFSLLRNLI